MLVPGGEIQPLSHTSDIQVRHSCSTRQTPGLATRNLIQGRLSDPAVARPQLQISLSPQKSLQRQLAVVFQPYPVIAYVQGSA